MARWQLQEAKARFIEIVKASQSEGPQEITVRGEAAAVVLSKKDYDRLRRVKPCFVDFLCRSPLVGVELHFERDRSRARDVIL